MSIASAITAVQGRVADAYTAISNKGGTLPATQNLTNMPTAIASIPSGGGSQTKYGANADTFLGDVDANGVLQTPTEKSDIVFNGVTDIGSYVLENGFARRSIKSVSFPDLTTLSNSSALNNCFYNCLEIEEANFPSLVSISTTGALTQCFYNCRKLEIVDFSSLRSISNTSQYNYSFYYTFYYCTSLQEVSFPNLEEILGNNCFNSCFSNCTNLRKVYFPKLNTVSQTNAFGTSTYDYIFYNCSSLTEIHFNANSQSVISNLSGYSTKWGATNATIYFDQ